MVIMFTRRTSQERSICTRHTVTAKNVEILGEMQGKHMTCTWKARKLRLWTGRKQTSKIFFGYRRSAGLRCSDIGWDAYRYQNGAKMQSGTGGVWGHSGRHGAVWSVFKSFGEIWKSTKILGGGSRRVWWFGEQIFQGCSWALNIGNCNLGLRRLWSMKWSYDAI